MLTVARTATPPGMSIDWYEAGAEAMPLPDDAFDVVLCQMGLQFMSNKASALREIRRVLRRDGRVYINVPGPKPPLFGIMTDALACHISPQAGAFADVVFSLHDVAGIMKLMRDAGFREVNVRTRTKTLRLPAPTDFLWQYLYSTPLAEPLSKASTEQRMALEQEVCSQWESFVTDDGLRLEVNMTTAAAHT